MKIDLIDNQNLLYISDRCANKVVVRYSENHKFKTTFDILRPYFIEFDANYIYITSYPDFSISKSTNKVEGLQKKSNCIFLLNKNDFKTVRIISFDWLGPEGLFIDKNSNILTVAAELDRGSMESSTNCFLYVTGPNGTLIQNIEIEDVDDDEASHPSYLITGKFLFYAEQQTCVCISFVILNF